MDLVITEASFLKKGGIIQKDKETGRLFGHTGIPNLLRMFRSCTKTILLVHFGTWYLENKKSGKKRLQALAKENKVNVIPSYDGQEIQV